MAAYNTATFHIGETWPISGVVNGADGNPQDISAASMLLEIGTQNFVVSASDAPNGLWSIDIAPASQTGFTEGTYPFVFSVTFADGTISFQNYGQIILRAKPTP